MGDILHLTSEIPVSINHYLKPRVFMAKGKPMISMYVTSDAKKYKVKFEQYIKEQVKEQGYDLTPNKFQHFYVDCNFYFSRIDCDANNYFKIMLDTITETQLIWLDDNVVAERVNRIMYDSKNPRIEMVIKPVDYIGIFNNKDELDRFEDKCKTCKRYNNNCSILNKAKEGRVQDEIVDLECGKYKD